MSTRRRRSRSEIYRADNARKRGKQRGAAGNPGSKKGSRCARCSVWKMRGARTAFPPSTLKRTRAGSCLRRWRAEVYSLRFWNALACLFPSHLFLGHDSDNSWLQGHELRKRHIPQHSTCSRALLFSFCLFLPWYSQWPCGARGAGSFRQKATAQ